MLIGAEAKKEKLVSLRIEYAALFTHFHFFQGLRFAILAAVLPILGGLFNYYRTALPFSEIVRLWEYSIAVNVDPYTAIIVASVGLGVLVALRSIEYGIMLQTSIIVVRGGIIENQLSIQGGAFSLLRVRLSSSKVTHRISGIIRIGSFVGGGMCLGLGLWAAARYN